VKEKYLLSLEKLLLEVFSMKRIMFILILNLIVLVNGKFIVNAEEEYKVSPLNEEGAYQNFVIGLINNKVGELISEHYNGEYTGFRPASKDYIDVKQLMKVDNEKKSIDIKFAVTLKVIPLLNEEKNRNFKGADILYLELYPEHISNGNWNKALKLLDYKEER
jgi:hypothetical protein